MSGETWNEITYKAAQAIIAGLTITATNPSVSPTGAAVPASATLVGGSDGTNTRALKVASDGTVQVAGSFSATTAASATAAAPSYAEGTSNALSQTLTGDLRVIAKLAASQTVGLAAGSAAIGSITNTGFNITGTLPAFAATPTVNIGTAPSMVVTEADGANVALGAKADAASATGSQSLISIAKQLHADMIAATPAGSAIIGKVGIDQTTPGTTNSVSISPISTGGTSVYSAVGGTGNALLTNTKVLVQGSATSMYGVALWSGIAAGGADTFLQCFDAATTGAVTLGTTVPTMVFRIPASGAWEEKWSTSSRVAFLLGLVIAATTTATGSTAPGTGVQAAIVYK